MVFTPNTEALYLFWHCELSVGVQFPVELVDQVACVSRSVV